MKGETVITASLSNGIMTMGGEVTPENLRKAKLVIDTMLGENKPTECSGCNCINVQEQLLGKVNAEQKARRDNIGSWVCDQINSLLYLAHTEGIDVSDCSDIEYDSDFEEITFN